MTNRQEWDEFLSNLITNATKEYQDTEEYKHQRRRQAQMDECLETNLAEDQKVLVDEILFELGVAAERETEVVYRQGLLDCVWLLKNLGVLA